MLPALAGASPYATEATEKAVAAPKAPTAKLVNSKNVQLNWKKVKSATQYVVYHKEVGGTYKRLGTSGGSVLGFTDTTAKAGTPYYYAVRARGVGGLSKFSPDKGFIVLKKPVLSFKKVRGDSEYPYSCEMRWTKSPGATAYRISWGYTVRRQVFPLKVVSVQPASEGRLHGFSSPTPLGEMTFRVQPVYQDAFKVLGPKSAVARFNMD